MQKKAAPLAMFLHGLAHGKKKFLRIIFLTFLTLLIFFLISACTKTPLQQNTDEANENQQKPALPDNDNTPPPLLSGSGTKDSPYLISNESNLYDIRTVISENPNFYLYFQLTSDIFLRETPDNSNCNFIPFNTFNGEFDGKGFKVDGFSIITPELTAALFLNVEKGGVIKNLNLSNAYVYGKSSGGIAGENYGNISNCKTSGSIKGVEYTGGIAGKNYGSIKECENQAAIYGVSGYATHTGGIAGGVCADGESHGSIYKSVNKGHLTGCINVGGIAGIAEAGCTVSNSLNTGTITANGGFNIGGIAGADFTKSKTAENFGIKYCINSGFMEVTACDFAGAITGFCGFNILNPMESYSYTYMCYYNENITSETVSGKNGVYEDGKNTVQAKTAQEIEILVKELVTNN